MSSPESDQNNVHNQQPSGETVNNQHQSHVSYNRKSLTAQAWLAWAIVSFFYAFQYVLRVSPSIIMDDIRVKFSLDTQQFGDFSGIYYIGYALAHIPVGLLLDHFSPRHVISFSILLCSLGLIPLVYSDIWELAFWGRFLIGVGSSTAILGVFKVIRLNFPAKKMGTILGFSVTLGLIGAIYGGRPIQNLVVIYDWQTVLLMLVGAGIVLAVLTFFLIPRRKDPEETTSHGSILRDLKIAWKAPYVISTAFLAAFMVGPMEGFADIWGVSYLIQVYDYSKDVASYLPSLIFIGMGVGSPLLAFWAEKMDSHQGIVRLSALVMGVLFMALLFYKLALWQVQITMFFVGIFSAYQVLVMYINGMRVEAKFSGIVTAVTNMIIMSFGYIFHHLIGRIMNHEWAGETVDGIRVYPSDAYTNGLLIIPAALFLAFIGFYGEKIYAKFFTKH